MHYCGIDLASKTSAICVVTNEGKVLQEVEVPTERKDFEQALKEFDKLRCVMEASPLSEWVATQLEEIGHEPIIIDTRKAKALISTKKKTDKIDAKKLAQMARTGWYTEIHRKSKEARMLRTWLQSRRGLVMTTLAMNSRIRGLLRAHGIRLGEVPDCEFKIRVKQLSLGCDKSLWALLKPLCKTWENSLMEAEGMRRKIDKQAKKDSLCQLLMTAPGVGPLVASSFVCTIDDPTRFQRGDQLTAYLGLVPSVRQSGDNIYLGRVTKEGDEVLRSLLVGAAHVLMSNTKGTFPLKKWGLKLKAKKGHNKAKVAVARKLAMILHQIWLTGRPFNYNY